VIDLAIITVAYKSLGDLPSLLGSIPQAVGTLTWHLVVVDNYSLDGLEERFGATPQVSVFNSGENLGYSGGLNAGLAHAPASRFTVFLNADLTLKPDSLVLLVDALKTENTAVSVPLLVDEDGRIQPSLRREPATLRALGEAVFGDHWPRRPSWLSEMVRNPDEYHGTKPVEWATGAALMIKSDVLSEVGPWDSERFFLYSEETDYFRRVRQQGFGITFVPDAVVGHRGGGSGTSLELNALMAVNKVRYFRKWHGAGASSVFFAATVLHSLLRIRRPESSITLRALFSSAARAALPGGGS